MTAEPIAYTALTEGTPVQSSDGATFGEVEHVLEIPAEDLFDGIVVKTPAGLRFVDRDQTDQITTEYVRTTLSAEQAAALPEPSGGEVYTVDDADRYGETVSSRFARLFHRSHWNREH